MFWTDPGSDFQNKYTAEHGRLRQESNQILQWLQKGIWRRLLSSRGRKSRRRRWWSSGRRSSFSLFLLSGHLRLENCSGKMSQGQKYCTKCMWWSQRGSKHSLVRVSPMDRDDREKYYNISISKSQLLMKTECIIFSWILKTFVHFKHFPGFSVTKTLLHRDSLTVKSQ